MPRHFIIAVVALVVAATAACAETFHAFLIWVDVPGKKLVVIKIPHWKPDEGPGDGPKILRGGKETTFAVDDKVKVFTPKEKAIGREVEENPAGLAAIKMPRRINPKLSTTTRIVELERDEQANKLTTIKIVSFLVIEKRKDK
jgi:hypothetical protein